MVRIAFIGFGQAGHGLAKGLKQEGVEDIFFFDSCWNKPPYDETIRSRAEDTGAILKHDMVSLLDVSQNIISCVAGAQAVSAAESAAAHLKPCHLYIDVNTTAPKKKEDVASIIESTGAAFVDAAMMGAIPAFLHRVPIMASGSGAKKFKELMSPYGMRITIVGEKPGHASAIKMFRSIFMKGFLCLLLETLSATHKYDVDGMVLESIAETMEKDPFLDTVRLQVLKGVVHAGRMEHEMEDVIQTLRDMGIPPTMSQAAKEKLDWCKRFGFKTLYGGEMPESLDEVLDIITKESEQA